MTCIMYVCRIYLYKNNDSGNTRFGTAMKVCDLVWNTKTGTRKTIKHEQSDAYQWLFPASDV